MEKLIDKVRILSDTLKEQETKIRQKAIFCKEHKFYKEEEWLRMKLNVIQEIRSEVDLLQSDNEYKPLFQFD